MFPNRKYGASPSSVRAAAREADHERERMVISTQDARQASPRRTNFRVLIVSLTILFAVGVALTAAYWGTAVEDHAIPSGPAQDADARKAMDGSSQAPEATPNTKPPAAQ